jgi:hypothetical protein
LLRTSALGWKAADSWSSSGFECTLATGTRESMVHANDMFGTAQRRRP